MAKITINAVLELEGGDADVFSTEWEAAEVDIREEAIQSLKNMLAGDTGMDVTSIEVRIEDGDNLTVVKR